MADLEGRAEEHQVLRQVRARHDDDTLVVYQAYSPAIAEPALRAGTFVSPFKRERMTWIKPSFNWMMYRCGWAEKPGQERVLAITITRAGFDWALEHSCLADEASKERKHASPVRVQWDPERDVALQRLEHRAIQVGLGGEAVGRYVDEWITGIEDVTPLAREVAGLVRAGDLAAAARLVPEERPLELSAAAAAAVGVS
ncbi:DUF4291 domain-containing protein [Solirubrobacter soli]|uniref:DUF4291 domain-containing protein n=1 Tax=Solirubrobacter soli TaxID=363832 RepID=UPI00069FB2A3|nr:DUF4291 domain-containing protein [Solirubrobacter soli]